MNNIGVGKGITYILYFVSGLLPLLNAFSSLYFILVLPGVFLFSGAVFYGERKSGNVRKVLITLIAAFAYIAYFIVFGMMAAAAGGTLYETF